MSQDSNIKHSTIKDSPLLDAIRKLDKFTQYNDSQSKAAKSETLPFSNNLKIREGKLITESTGPFQVLVNLIKPLFSPHAHKQQQEKLRKAQVELSDAVNVIKRYYEQILKWQEEGTEEGDAKANYAQDVINAYNLNTKEPSQNSLSVFKRISNFINERTGLAIPVRKIERQQSHTVTSTSKKTLDNLSVIFSAPNTSQDKRISFSNSPTHKKQFQCILDAYHFKVTQRVYEKYAKNLSLSEIREWIKKTRLEIVDNASMDEITIEQFLRRPGQTLRVYAIFKRNSTGKLMSIPILNSVIIEEHSCNSEFPLPSDHTAFVFPPILTKPNPLNPEDVPIYSEIETQKDQLAQNLLSRPATEKQAIQMVGLKKEVFNTYKDEFIQHHIDLTESMFKCAGVKIPEELRNFYKYVAETDSPFDILSQINQYIMFRLIIQPAYYINHEWLEENELLLKGNHKERTEAAKLLMQKFQELPKNSNEEKCVADYISLLSGLLGPAMINVFLNINSEKYNCAPPMLSHFEQCLLACAFQQLLAYLDEADIMLDVSKEKNLVFIRQWLEGLLQKDIKIFSNYEETPASIKALMEELHVYFNTRYYENLSHS